MIIGYLMLTALCVLLFICLGVVAHQRDTALAERDAARAELRGARR